MLIVVAPDSFKSTATATEAARGIAQGVAEVLPDATIKQLPMADGGEGTAEVIAQALAASKTSPAVEKVEIPSTDARGRLISASYFLHEKTAYIDVAAASGLPAVEDHKDVLHADSYGTGVLIADAESRGATHIVLGLGGSATVDGGMGIITALGGAPMDDRGYPLPKGGAPLVMLDSIDTAQLNIKAAGLKFTLLGDTTCPPLHAASMYGPQKGASDQDVPLLTGALMKLCEVTDIDVEREGFGAAGAIPVGMTWLSALLYGSESNIELQPGAQFVAELLGLQVALEEARAAGEQALIITGEGAFDEQSLTGKVVGTIADIADASGASLGIVAGRLDSPVPEGALSAQLSQNGRMHDQLKEAGRAIAEGIKGASH
ncbi:glycerate kinase [Corynebacteriaceae bacterium 6-324]